MRPASAARVAPTACPSRARPGRRRAGPPNERGPRARASRARTHAPLPPGSSPQAVQQLREVAPDTGWSSRRARGQSIAIRTSAFPSPSDGVLIRSAQLGRRSLPCERPRAFEARAAPSPLAHCASLASRSSAAAQRRHVTGIQQNAGGCPQPRATIRDSTSRRVRPQTWLRGPAGRSLHRATAAPARAPPRRATRALREPRIPCRWMWFFNGSRAMR